MHRQKPANEHPATESGPAPTPTPAPTVSSGPFLGVSAVIPGTVEAEEFDYGGEGVGYPRHKRRERWRGGINTKCYSFLDGFPNTCYSRIS